MTLHVWVVLNRFVIIIFIWQPDFKSDLITRLLMCFPPDLIAHIYYF